MFLIKLCKKTERDRKTVCVFDISVKIRIRNNISHEMKCLDVDPCNVTNTFTPSRKESV